MIFQQTIRRGDRGRVPSKAALEAEERAKEQEALARPLPAANRGHQMLVKMGFKPGTALGAEGNANARAEPLEVVVREGREGIGMESERERKRRAIDEAKKARRWGERRMSGGEYREEMSRGLNEGRLEGLVRRAMWIAEELHDGADAVDGEGEGEAEEQSDAVEAEEEKGEAKEGKKLPARPTRRINVLWRGLIRERETKEKDRRARYDLYQSLSRNPAYNDPEEEEQDRTAFGALEEEVEEEDPELDAFNALPPAERLGKVLNHLRTEHFYCFWCKCKYPDEEMDECPGPDEEDHD